MFTMNFDIEVFNKKTQDFIKEIEQEFGHEIRVEYIDLEEGHSGFCNVDETGTPTVTLNSNEKDAEKIKHFLIHETYHLRLLLNKFPMFASVGNAQVVYVPEYYKYISNNFWDKIVHSYFYPKIKNELDHDPYKHFEPDFNLIKNSLLEKKFSENSDDVKKMRIIGWYHQIWAEGKKEDLLEYESLVKEYHNSLGLKESEKMIKIFEKRDIKNSKDLIDIFIEFFNAIHEDREIILVSEEVKLRGSFELQVAYFTVYKLDK